MVLLTKSQMVMGFLWLADSWAIFTYDGYAEEDPQFMKLRGEVWEDMGKPQQITVTIEPGDTLNG